MRIVQSYNGSIDFRVGVTRWMAALSAIYLCRFDVHSVLYADKRGLENLGDITDLYSEVIQIDIPSWVDRRCFAAIKFFAMENEKLGVLHIDNDVLLKSDDVLDKVENLSSSCDIVAQGIERYTPYAYIDCVQEFKNAGYEFDYDVTHHTPINTGVISILNQDLKRDYFSMYMDATKAVSKWLETRSTYVCPDFVPEQTALYSMCKKRGYRVGEIVDGESFDECIEQANKLGYAHFMGSTKTANINNIKQRVRELDSELYDKIARLP